jgi:hypothetical protein
MADVAGTYARQAELSMGWTSLQPLFQISLSSLMQVQVKTLLEDAYANNDHGKVKMTENTTPKNPETEGLLRVYEQAPKADWAETQRSNIPKLLKRPTPDQLRASRPKVNRF